MERLVDYDKFIKDYGVLSNHEDDYRLLCAAKITAYTTDEVIAMLTELKTEIGKMSDTVVEDRTITITSWNGMQKRICKFIQSKIDKLKETPDGNDY